MKGLYCPPSWHLSYLINLKHLLGWIDPWSFCSLFQTGRNVDSNLPALASPRRIVTHTTDIPSIDPARGNRRTWTRSRPGRPTPGWPQTRSTSTSRCGPSAAPHRWPPNHGHDTARWLDTRRARPHAAAGPTTAWPLSGVGPPARRDPPPHAAAAQPPSRNDAVGNGAPARAFFCRGKRPASSPRRRVRPFRCVVGFQNFFLSVLRPRAAAWRARAPRYWCLARQDSTGEARGFHRRGCTPIHFRLSGHTGDRPNTCLHWWAAAGSISLRT